MCDSGQEHCGCCGAYDDETNAHALSRFRAIAEHRDGGETENDKADKAANDGSCFEDGVAKADEDGSCCSGSGDADDDGDDSFAEFPTRRVDFPCYPRCLLYTSPSPRDRG